MLVLPVTQKALVLDKQWAVWASNKDATAVLSRLDVDHRIGQHQMMDWEESSLDLKMLKSGSVCLLHREENTQLVFPPTAERVTRLFVGRQLTGTLTRRADAEPMMLPRWPIGPFSRASLLPVVPPIEMNECDGASCEVYLLQRHAGNED